MQLGRGRGEGEQDMRGEKAFGRLAQAGLDGKRVLDIGPGEGEATERLRSCGAIVDTAGPQDGCTFQGLWPKVFDLDMSGRYDAVWSAHTLEHALDPHGFLAYAIASVKTGGLLAVTVPPLKTALVGGHVNLYTPGLLVYQVVLAGLDCSNAEVWRSGYDVSCVVKVEKESDLSGLVYDAGDIETLARFFPVAVRQNIDGFDVVTE